MAGVIPADAVMHEKPQGRGLAVLEETGDGPWPAAAGGKIPAHEFHYAALENLDPSLRFAYKVARGAGIGGGRDGIVLGNLLASFCHLRSTEGNPWVDRFLNFVRAHKAAAGKRSF
jgi:cobyrinic acid a,c-diamide synthase